MSTYKSFQMASENHTRLFRSRKVGEQIIRSFPAKANSHMECLVRSI